MDWRIRARAAAPLIGRDDDLLHRHPRAVRAVGPQDAGFDQSQDAPMPRDEGHVVAGARDEALDEQIDRTVGPGRHDAFE